MSVLIKGMDMPKTCEECALNYDSCACIKTGSRFFRGRETEFDPFKGRLEDCPLVPVPPHGDLIERDEAVRDLRMDYAYAAARIVALRPVIIPADRPKEEAPATDTNVPTYDLLYEEGGYNSNGV